jgi:ABC-type sulfate transport system permease component
VLDACATAATASFAMGAGRLLPALLLLARALAVLTVLLTAFGRAVAEVGAVMIVGGNIDGVTRVMTTAIALETSKGDLPLALALGIVLLGVVGCSTGDRPVARRRADRRWAASGHAAAHGTRLAGPAAQPPAAVAATRTAQAGVRFGA